MKIIIIALLLGIFLCLVLLLLHIFTEPKTEAISRAYCYNMPSVWQTNKCLSDFDKGLLK